MSTNLLERDLFLQDLSDLLRGVASGTGRCVLVSGEAGIGKSSLIEHFADLESESARFLWGRCEALFTPRPLGPLHDIAQQLQGPVRDLLEHEASRTTLFSAFLEALGDSSIPTVVVIEDAHWADEATLDVLKFLGRRIQQVPVLLVITYRDDEIGPDHPLWFVLGDLPSRNTKRLHLPPLSREAVADLARGSFHSSDSLYRVTGGNPFFVTEALASGEAGVPETVRAAVLARAAHLSPQGRAVLDLASVVPARTELWLVEIILPQSAHAIEECAQAGVLHQEHDGVMFRHELARQAVESTLPPLRMKELHASVLRALLEKGSEPSIFARLVHHAALAGDGAAVHKYAPDAAGQAAQNGAHREAAAHYATALRFADALSPSERAELFEGQSYECYLTNQLEDAAESRAKALALWRELGVGENVGRSLRWLSRLTWFLGDKAPAEHYAAEAIAALEVLPPGRELAMAYSNMSQLRMLEGNLSGAMHWGILASDLAQKLSDDEILVHALNNMGTAQFEHGDEEGHARLEASLRLALERGFEEHAARAFTNLGGISMGRRQYARASHYFDDGIIYCTERDLDSWRLYMTGSRARVRFEMGDWTGAADDVAEVLTRYRVPPAIRIPALIVQAWVRLRRGDPGSVTILDEVKTMALKMGEPQRIVPVATARAEAAWLRGDLATSRAEARAGYEFATEHTDSWELGQLSYWLWKTGDPLTMPPGLPEPYALQFAGDWRSAAAAWERLGCPYEQALALAEGDAAARRAALSILDRLGASATSERLTQQQIAGRVHGVLRGPRSSTRANPAGLTNRQLEVLLLLAEGFSNPEIAMKLSASPKTIEHHISSILAKLHARSRTQAITVAHNLGAIPTSR
jgi:DNA-binding CsgD family transcriptional regulator